MTPLNAVPLTTNLVRDLESALVDNANQDKYNTIQVLTYSSGSMMGDSSRAFDPHDHGVQPRHVQEFVDVIQQVRGGRVARGAALMLSYHITGGRTAPGLDERLEVEGDAFRLWRSTGVAVVGRFAGTLPSDTARDLGAAASGARGIDPPTPEASPGAPSETVAIDDVSLRGDLEDLPGPWGAVVERLRDLLERLIDSPEAAIALELDGDGRGASLVHRGRAPIEVDLSEARVSVHAWQGYYEPAGSWKRGPLALDAPGTAEPGWRVALPFEHDLELGPDRTLQVEVDFALRTATSGAPSAPRTCRWSKPRGTPAQLNRRRDGCGGRR